MAKKCPKCGYTDEFYVSAHVVQDWKVDSDGEFLDVVNDCSTVAHYPDNDDIWECGHCNYDAPGSEFEVD